MGTPYYGVLSGEWIKINPTSHQIKLTIKNNVPGTVGRMERLATRKAKICKCNGMASAKLCKLLLSWCLLC